MKKVNRYHQKFIELLMAENVIGIFSRYKGASKEITESMAMVEAARKYAWEDFENHLVLVVGDGCSPRTGAMFAYLTKASVISIDPNMNMDHWADHCSKQEKMGFPVQRLDVRKVKVEDINGLDCGGKPLIVAWPHSHASMNAFTPTNLPYRIDIAMPCCFAIPQSWMKIPHTCFQDTEVLSPKNIIHIWETEGDIKEVHDDPNM